MKVNSYAILAEMEKNLKEIIFDTGLTGTNTSLWAAERLKSEILGKIKKVKAYPEETIRVGDVIAWSQGVAEYLRTYFGLHQEHFKQVREAMTDLKVPYYNDVKLSGEKRKRFIEALEVARRDALVRSLLNNTTNQPGAFGVNMDQIKIFTFLLARLSGEIPGMNGTDVSWEEFFGITSAAFVVGAFDEKTATQVSRICFNFLNNVVHEKTSHEFTL